MADDAHLRGVQDRTRISMIQDDEVRYWTEKFGVTREQLQKAVDQAGPMADAVEWRLRRARSPGAG
jgi:hypothetical protein